jgi:hypothetical protein
MQGMSPASNPTRFEPALRSSTPPIRLTVRPICNQLCRFLGNYYLFVSPQIFNSLIAVHGRSHGCCLANRRCCLISRTAVLIVETHQPHGQSATIAIVPNSKLTQFAVILTNIARNTFILTVGSVADEGARTTCSFVP